MTRTPIGDTPPSAGAACTTHAAPEARGAEHAGGASSRFSAAPRASRRAGRRRRSAAISASTASSIAVRGRGHGRRGGTPCAASKLRGHVLGAERCRSATTSFCLVRPGVVLVERVEPAAGHELARRLAGFRARSPRRRGRRRCGPGSTAGTFPSPQPAVGDVDAAGGEVLELLASGRGRSSASTTTVTPSSLHPVEQHRVLELLAGRGARRGRRCGGVLSGGLATPTPIADTA